MHTPITIILPVYGRSELLKEALCSVLSQDSNNWRLLIADDGSDSATQDFLECWMAQYNCKAVQWIKRPQNLGLFANLNQAIEQADSEWVLLLCSDDLLFPSAVRQIESVRLEWPKAELIMSTFKSLNEDGSERRNDHEWHHDQISRKTSLIPTEQILRALLQLGSINGNLTGMAFSRMLWKKAGPFRSDWRHAADWEWLIRAVSAGPIVLSRKPIARVRTHVNQLSNANRRSGHELHEVGEVVRTLVAHPMLAREPRRSSWAAHVMQFQLWNVLKAGIRRPASLIKRDLRTIHRAAGLGQTAVALIRWLPTRWRQLQRTNGR